MSKEDMFQVMYEIKKGKKDFPQNVSELIILLNNSVRKQKLKIINEAAKK